MLILSCFGKGVTAECGDGPYSPSVCVTCDGVVPSPLTIVPTGMVSTVKVHLDPPTVHGNIKIRAYKVNKLKTWSFFFVCFQLTRREALPPLNRNHLNSWSSLLQIIGSVCSCSGWLTVIQNLMLHTCQ